MGTAILGFERAHFLIGKEVESNFELFLSDIRMAFK